MKDNYGILSITKGVSERGSNYFDIECVCYETGEKLQCVYFGNTVPKRVLDVITKTTKSGNQYLLAVIQPHTSRDKKTGRFTTYRRAEARA